MARPADDVRCRTLTEAYQRQGIAKVKGGIRQAWSQQSGDGMVVVTLWTDLFEDQSRRVFNCLHEPLRSWVDAPANRRRKAHLEYVRSLDEPIFKSILVAPAGSGHSRGRSWEIGPDMRLTDLDSRGRFRAVRASEHA
jgi:hypothetical protein